MVEIYKQLNHSPFRNYEPSSVAAGPFTGADFTLFALTCSGQPSKQIFFTFSLGAINFFFFFVHIRNCPLVWISFVEGQCLPRRRTSQDPNQSCEISQRIMGHTVSKRLFAIVAVAAIFVLISVPCVEGGPFSIFKLFRRNKDSRSEP